MTNDDDDDDDNIDDNVSLLVTISRVRFISREESNYVEVLHSILR